MSFKKFPAKAATIVMPLILSIIMTCIVSAISVLRSTGFTLDFVHLWPGAWLLSWFIAFPTLLIVLPAVRRIVGALVEKA